jgi:hypothetical protein
MRARDLAMAAIFLALPALLLVLGELVLIWWLHAW